MFPATCFPPLPLGEGRGEGVAQYSNELLAVTAAPFSSIKRHLKANIVRKVTLLSVCLLLDLIRFNHLFRQKYQPLKANLCRPSLVAFFAATQNIFGRIPRTLH